MTGEAWTAEGGAVLRGRIFNTQRYSVQDGPGIRTTVFLKGCPLHCAWCHNPESIKAGRELVLLENRCLVCGTCREACPFADATGERGPVPVGQPECTLCGGCVEACPAAAREILGREVGVEDLLREILADRVFYEDSGGGVTFSGGEPFLQPEFLLALLEACRKEGVHTVVDTCGIADTRHLLRAVPHTSLFLYDLKIMDEASHRLLVGASNRAILDNLRALDAAGTDLWIRVPLVPGMTDGSANLSRIAAFVAGLKSVRQICLLPYHRIGVAKAARLGRAAAGTDAELRTPTPEQVRAALHCFQGCPAPTRVGG